MPVLDSELPPIGWREWVNLPTLGVKWIKAKVDTGARSSCLHADAIHLFDKDNEQWVQFQVYPIQRSDRKVISVEAKVLELRKVRSSSGQSETRPVIVTNVSLRGSTWPVELTLTNRHKMGFRMLLGREAFRGRFVVDASRSYYSARPKKKRTK